MSSREVYLFVGAVMFCLGIFVSQLTSFLFADNDDFNTRGDMQRVVTTDQLLHLYDRMDYLANMLQEQQAVIRSIDAKLYDQPYHGEDSQFICGGADISEHRVLLEELDGSYFKEMESYTSAEDFVQEQQMVGVWSSEDALHLAKLSQNMNHEQRADIQLMLEQAINRGDIVPEDVTAPLF